MAYDIYGNNLRDGHCEVHPSVHEQYPCSLCYIENNNRHPQQQPEPCYDCMRYGHLLPEFIKAARATVLFYTVAWTDEKKTEWFELVGKEEATTKVLADFCRGVLKMAEDA